MKKRLLNLALIVAMLNIYVPVFAQAIEDGSVIIPSTQTWNFMKYGGHQPNLYTGTVNVSIPLYTYKDRDFEIPISIDYASNGYMPNILAGMTGLGWRLNCGGMITREIKGIPDEKMIFDFSDIADNMYQYIYGYQYLIKNPNNKKYITKPGVYVRPYTMGSNFNYEPDLAIYNHGDLFSAFETQPDIYTFNFMGYTGRFMFDLNGSACIFESNTPQGLIDIKINTDDTTCPFFTITTGDGYEYKFGSGTSGGIYYENFAYEYKCYDSEDGDSPDYPITYLITEIKAPNDRKVLFKYSDGIIRRQPSLPTDIYAMGEISNVNPNKWISGSSYSMRSSDLESIEIEDFQAKIIYGRKEKRERYVDNPESYWYTNIAGLLCQYNSSDSTYKIVKKCEFNYKYAQSGNPVMLLQDVQISGEGTYKMVYYNDEYFPFLSHHGVDHWGYWRSSSSPIYAKDLIPANAGVNGQVWPIENDSRSPVFDYAVRGMLKKLEYPTKGWSIFEYEPHKYTNVVIREYPFYSPRLKTVPEGEAGGVRICKITDYASDSSHIEKIYKYEDSTNLSSGNLLKIPLYMLAYNIERPCIIESYNRYLLGHQNFTVIQGSVIDMSQYFFNQPHIEYSKVAEIASDGSKTVYEFTDYSTYPDMSVPDIWIEPYTKSTPDNIDKLVSLSSSLNPRRGKPTITTMFKNRQPVYKEEFKYTLLSDTSYMIPLAARCATYPAFILGDYNMYLEVKKTTTYFNGQAVLDTIVYGYNRYGQKAFETTRDELGRYYTTKTEYLGDIPSSSYSNIEKIMAEKKLFSYPIAEEQTINYESLKGLSSEYYLNKTKYIYKNHNDQRRMFNIEKTLKATYKADQRVITPIHSDFRVEKYVELRDNLGNPILVTDRVGIKTGYIWGYKGLYPIARIENISDISQIKSIQGLNDIDLTPLNKYFTIEQEQTLLNIPNTLVTLYDYEPFVGIVKTTDSSGKVTYFDYDQGGKLITKRDDTGNLIESYQYNVIK